MTKKQASKVLAVLLDHDTADPELALAKIKLAMRAETNIVVNPDDSPAARRARGLEPIRPRDV